MKQVAAVSVLTTAATLELVAKKAIGLAVIGGIGNPAEAPGASSSLPAATSAATAATTSAACTAATAPGVASLERWARHGAEPGRNPGELTRWKPGRGPSELSRSKPG